MAARRKLFAVCGPPIALLIGVFACKGPTVPTPPMREHAVASEAKCVPYPPPPPKVEEIPARPSGAHLWIDGQWTWETRRWVWKPGGWTVAPDDAYYAAWKLERLQNGALVYHAGHWVRDEQLEQPKTDAEIATCPAPPLAEKPVVFVDAQLEAEAHVGPVLVYPADAPSSAPGKVQLDATIPESGVAEAPPPLIGPPD